MANRRYRAIQLMCLTSNNLKTSCVNISFDETEYEMVDRVLNSRMNIQMNSINQSVCFKFEIQKQRKQIVFCIVLYLFPCIFGREIKIHGFLIVSNCI